MTDTFVGTPGSVQRHIISAEEDRPRTSKPVVPAQLADNATTADVAEIAYELWKRNGCQSGSAEADWLEAEQIVRQRVNLG
jgi:hypothetical protein